MSVGYLSCSRKFCPLYWLKKGIQKQKYGWYPAWKTCWFGEAMAGDGNRDKSNSINQWF